MIARTAFCTITALALSACGPSETQKRWDGAVVVKICRDGTFIYRLKDGQYRITGLASAVVEDPRTVCQSGAPE